MTGILIFKIFVGIFLLGLVLTVIFSWSECIFKAHKYQSDVAYKLHTNFGMREDVAKILVEEFYPTLPLAVQAHPHPDLGANRVFWSSGYQKRINHIHFMDNTIPYHLFDSNNWGRITLEA